MLTHNPSSTLRYPSKTLKRAERAVQCSPFRLALFAEMKHQSVDLRAISGNSGLSKLYTRRPLAELVAESELLWLINVGLLRREVDGQGLTDSFRLTPLGRQLVDQWQTQPSGLPSPSWVDFLYNALNRWLRLDF